MRKDEHSIFLGRRVALVSVSQLLNRVQSDSVCFHRTEGVFLLPVS